MKSRIFLKVALASLGLVLFLQQLVLAEDGPAEITFNEGVSFLQQDEYRKAISSFEKCIQLLPENDRHLDSVYDNLGLAYVHIGKAEEAIEYFKKSININPLYALPYCHLGAAYRKKGDFLSAIAALLDAIRLKPDYVESFDELWRSYGELGRQVGYDLELVLREAYHIEKLLEANPEYLQGDQSLIQELQYLIIVEKELSKTEGQVSEFRIKYRGRDETKNGQHYNFVVNLEDVVLPEDNISQEEKQDTLARAKIRVEKL